MMNKNNDLQSAEQYEKDTDAVAVAAENEAILSPTFQPDKLQ